MQVTDSPGRASSSTCSSSFFVAATYHRYLDPYHCSSSAASRACGGMPPRKRKQRDGEEEKPLCVACTDSPATMLQLECGHCCLCTNCAFHCFSEVRAREGGKINEAGGPA